MLTPTIYKSTDPGAPALTGQAGSLAALLDAILVTGYGSGADQVAGLGWTSEFIGTNKRVYRNNPVTGTGHYLRLDDTNNRYGIIRGYEAMTSVDDGTNYIPLDDHQPIGSIWPKSSADSALARDWWAIGNERCLYFGVRPDSSSTQNHIPFFIGDIVSFKPGDRGHFAVSVDGATSYVSSRPTSYLFRSVVSNNSGVTSNPSLIFARSYDGLTRGIRSRGAQAGPQAMSDWGGSGATMVYPDPISGGLLYDVGYQWEGYATWLVRGRLPGLYVPLHQMPFADETRLVGVQGMPEGTTLFAKVFSLGTSTTIHHSVLFDLTGEW